MPQPVFFPLHDPTSSPGPHFIGDHSKTRSKSGSRLDIPQRGRGLIQRIATSDWEDRHPTPLGVNTGGNGDSTCRQLPWEVCKEWRERGFVGYRQAVWPREKLSMEMEKLNTEERDIIHSVSSWGQKDTEGPGSRSRTCKLFL